MSKSVSAMAATEHFHHLLATIALATIIILSFSLMFGSKFGSIFADVAVNISQTTDTDFNNGNLSNVEVVGTGNGSSVRLEGAPGFLDTAYRTSVTVSSAAAATEETVLIELDTAALILAGQMQSDCRDIRFTLDDSSTSIDYWIESGCNSTATKFWVQIPTLAAGSTTIYAYYGNATLASESSMSNVLLDEPTVRIVEAPADGAWLEISFRPYQSPLIFGTSQSDEGEYGIVFEVRNVTNTSAEIRLCDSNGSNTDGCDTYPASNAGIIIVDPSMNSESGFEAGSFDIAGGITSSLQTVSFSESFSARPLVLTSIQTRNEDTPVESWPTSVTTTSLTAGICHTLSDDTCDSTHPTETLAWMAIDQSNNPFSYLSSAGSVTNVGNSEWTTIDYSGTGFVTNPVVLVGVQDNNGGQNPKIDEARNISTTDAEIRYCELDQGDDCDTHAGMEVGWYAAEVGNSLPSTTAGSVEVLLAPTGQWTSSTGAVNVIDLQWNGGWGNGAGSSVGFSANLQNVGVDANVTFQIRAADTLANLTSASYYTLGVATSSPYEVTNTDLGLLGIPTGSAGRYLQVKATLSTNDGITNPELDDFTIYYLADDTAPNVNASTIQMEKTQGGAAVSAGEWTNNVAPYFNWTVGNDTQSGLRGYCAYLGTDPFADPELSKGLLGTSPGSTEGTTCGFVVDSTNIDFSNTALRGSTWLTSSADSYYLHLKAVDNAGNVFSGASTSFDFKFDNTSPANPAYISLPGGFVADKDVTFIWPSVGPDAANDDHSGLLGLQYRISQTGVWYGDSHTGSESTDDLLVDDGNYTMDVTYDYPNINEGSNFIYVRAWDQAGNVSTSYVSGVLKLNTISPSPPRNLGVTPNDNSVNAYAFSWQSPSSFTGQEENLEYCYTVNTLPSAATCTYTEPGVTSLTANAYASQPGTNTFYVVARDEAGNISYDAYEFVQFSYSGTAPGIPTNLDVADISIKSTQSWRLALTWGVPSNQGAGVESYKVYRSAAGTTCAANFGSFTEVATVGSTYFSDVDLLQQTYSYCVTACDSANNCSAPSGTTSGYPDGKFTEPAPLIGGPSISSLTTRTARISWQTSRNSDTKVAYGLKSGEYFDEEPSISDQLTDHNLTLTALQPGTTYYYRAKWTDEDGNTGVSPEKLFTTLPSPSVKNVDVVKVGLDEALVKFTVSGAQRVRIYFGKTTSFGGLLPISTSTGESTYTAILEGLDDGTKYFFKINPVDTTGYEYEGTVLNFSTLPKPRVTNIQIEEVVGVAQPTVNITWQSNTEVSSILSYYPEGQPDAQREKIDIELVKGERTMPLSGLLPDTRYNLIVRGIDKIGNEAVSDVLTFTTATDTRPPQILNLQIEGDIANNVDDRNRSAQLIVSWQTDEPATSQVAFGIGTAGPYSQRTQEDLSLKTDHLVVISNLNVSEVYHLQAIANDSAENEGSSVDTVSITPKASDSAFEIVISNLGQIFGFLIN